MMGAATAFVVGQSKDDQAIRQGFATGAQAEFRLDYAYPTRTEERWASVSILPLRRPEGGAVIYCQDITAQQRARLEAERLRRDLTHVGRVTTMGEMAAALAHELNQPLTAILSNAMRGSGTWRRGRRPSTRSARSSRTWWGTPGARAT